MFDCVLPPENSNAMKNKQIALSLFCVFLLSPPILAEQPPWNLDGKTIWSREDGKATMSRENGVYLITHTGDRDWAVTLHPNIPVTPGDAFRISVTLQNTGKGNVGFTVGLFDGEKKVITWEQGKAVQKGNCEQKTLTDEFVIPWGGATIMPRITGHGKVQAQCLDLKLEKLDKVVLLNPEREIPTAGQAVIDLLPKNTAFAKSLHFQGDTPFVQSRGRIPRSWLDFGKKYQEKPTWRIAGADGITFNMMPTEPFKVTVGDRIFVSLRINLERGKPYLVLLPWQGGLAGKTPFATGTFRPDPGEEGGKWCCIHAYLDIPEGIDGMIPAVCCPDGAVFNVAEWTVSRPTEAELRPVRQKVAGHAKERREERLDRGLVAVRTGNDVYLGWRLLNTDRKDVGFDVYRFTKDGKEEKLNKTPILKTTDFIDKNVSPDKEYRWCVRVSTAGQRTRELPIAYESERVSAMEKPYVSIPLRGEKSFCSIAFADLNGDGKPDYVIKTPNSNIDPWYMYWNQSPETYKLQAYDSDGSFLWEYDLGWGIERGIWYSPYLVADLDGDGRAEIAVKTCPGDFRGDTGRVYSGPEHLSILDGKTGKERLHIDWPERDGLPYNHSNRHQLCLAFLDGKTPCIIALRGTYTRMTAVAFQMLTGPDRLEELWRWDNRWERHLGRWGQGAHTTHACDLDGDGRDEVILGSIVLDDDGSILWEQKLGHPDHVYAGDIDPGRPGMEVVYGIETRQRERNGVCMVDGKTGQLLWGHDKPTVHIHSTGMVSDIDAAHPGCETWSGEEDSEKDRWLRNAKGKVLTVPEQFPVRSLAPKSVWWDADLQRELIDNGFPVDFPSFEKAGETRFEGSIRLIGDLFGDWREEVVTSCENEIRIYTTTIPAEDRRTTLLLDRNYRATLTESTMGYPQIPLPSYDLSNTVKP